MWNRHEVSRPAESIFARDVQYIILVLSLIAFGVGLILLEAYNALIAFCQVFIVGVLVLGNSESACRFLLVSLLTSGLFYRIAFYLADGLPNLNFIAFGLDLGAVMLFGRIFDKSLRHRGYVVDRMVWAYLIFNSFMVLNVIRPGIAGTLWGWRWVCIPVLLYFVGRELIRVDGDMGSFIRFLTVLQLVLCVYGIYQWLFGLPFFEQPWLESLPEWGDPRRMIEGSRFLGGKPRVFSMMNGHSEFIFFSAFTTIMLVFSPQRYFPRQYKFVRVLTISSLAIYGFLSLERSFIGMVAIGVCSALVFSAWRERKVAKFLLMASVPLIAFVVLAMQIDPTSIAWSQSTVALRRLAMLTDLSASHSVRSRVSGVWGRAVNSLLSNPLGYGLGAFHYTSVIKDKSYFFSPHNMYLQIGLETGWMGLILFLTLMGLVFKELNKNMPNIGVPLYNATFGIMIAVLAEGMFNFPLENSLGFVFWFYLGGIVSLIQSHQHGEIGSVPGQLR